MTLRQILHNGWRKFIAALIMFTAMSLVSDTLCNDTISVIASAFTGVFVYCIMLFLMRDQFVFQIVSIGKKKLFKNI